MDEVEHDQSHCPDDDHGTECHDGTVYEPCGSEFCYGADTYVGVCQCRCHE